jgi:excisionase family DNA binding protein
MDNSQTSVSVLLTRLEACKQLRCSLTTLSRLEIPFVKIRRRVYFKQATITAWISAQEQVKDGHI